MLAIYYAMTLDNSLMFCLHLDKESIIILHKTSILCKHISTTQERNKTEGMLQLLRLILDAACCDQMI